MYPDLVWVWTAFSDLSASRQIGSGGVGGIPFDSLDRYAARYEIEDFERFHALIRAMDATYTTRVNRREDD